MAMYSKFGNRQNERIVLPDGRVIYLSRSCATVSCVVAIKDNTPHYLLVQRGTGVPDEQGRWVLPCGYLDWDESLSSGARREVYEETGFDIEAYLNTDHLLLCTDFLSGQPWYVNSEPSTDAKQNVSHYFGIIIEVESLPELTSKHAELNEVADLRWVPIDNISEYDIAFNHDIRIKTYNETINNTMELIGMIL